MVPLVAEKVLTGQLEQKKDELPEAKVPGPHKVQTAVPSAAVYEPGAQVRHKEAEL